MKDLLSSRLKRLRSSDTVTGLLLSIVVGLISGLGAVAFRWLITSFHALFFDTGARALVPLGRYYVILVPALGGILVGLLVYFLAREAKGHGVPEVMEAVALRGGRIRPRVALVKALASSICIGSGGSVGREGPIVQIGASAGSAIGQWLKLSDENVKTLVACGAAGGIAATFNAPIAGVLFALEVILGRVVTRRFGYVVISAVVANFLAQVFLGNNRAFAVPAFGVVSPWEFLFYAVLGVATGFGAQGFTYLLYKFEDLFDALKMPEYVKPVFGGVGVGLLGLYSPYIFGVGYDGITSALSGHLTIQILVTLFALKMVATSLTLGSGGSGGIFAPSLFMGAALGTALGTLFHGLYPALTAPGGAYGIVGMAALFAGAARAPFSAVLIIFEMTGDYAIILPTMTAVVISVLVSSTIRRETIYTLKLLRRGVDIEQEELADVMRTITVGEAMTADFPSVSASMPVAELEKLFRKSGHRGFPVLDDKGRLIGIVTITDLERSLGRTDNLTVADISTKSPFVAYPDQTLDRVLEATEEEYGRIPVVSRDNERRLVGVLRRHDIIRAYRKKVRKLGRLPKIDRGRNQP